MFGKFLPAQQIGHGEPELQCDACLEKVSAFEVNQDRGIRDENVQDDRCQAATLRSCSRLARLVG